MEFKIYNELPNEAKDIRTNVFINEQGFKNEFDDCEKISHHILCFVDGNAVGTARFFKDDETGNYHLGRIAVLKEFRKLHIGSKMLEFAENEIKKLGGKKIIISAQVRAKGFYKKCGFTEIGDEYLDEYCPHIEMHKSL